MIARFVGGLLALSLLVAIGVVWSRGRAAAPDPLPSAPRFAAARSDPAEIEASAPPAATDKTREEKRFDRYDHDHDGKVTREEYFANRRKAFARLDTNGDGRLTFDEWTTKAETKFATADGDKSGILDRTEFASTRVARKTPARRLADCPPQREAAADAED